MCLDIVDQASPASSSAGVEPVQHPLQQDQVATVASVGRPVDHDQVLIGHVTNQDADDTEGNVELCGDLGDGQDVVAEGGDGFPDRRRRERRGDDARVPTQVPRS
jgi:hypothetical protein